MNLVKKKVDIDERYSMYFDMQSVVMYKDAKHSFVEGFSKLTKLEDEAILDFIACTLRDKEKNYEPVGFEIVKENPMYFLANFGFIAVGLVLDGFEDSSEKKK